MNKYCFIIIVLFFANQIQAKNIESQIIDENGVPLEYVNVTLFALPDTTYISGTTTDEKGYFTIKNIPENIDVLLRISFIGYNDVEKKLRQSDLNNKLSPIILHETYWFGRSNHYR